MPARNSFKIFPLLILVAFMSMAVRLGEVVTGVSHWSGAAFAESSSKMDEKEDHVADKEGMHKDDKKDTVEKKSKDKSGDPYGKVDVSTTAKDNIIWRDASDSDMGVSAVKMEMFEDLVKRREDLDKREKDLMTRQALSQAAEQELERKYLELDNIRGEIKSLLKQQSEEEQERIGSLVKIYEGMKAKEAARIFNTLDLDVLVSVMTRMSERKISPVLAAMDPERARTITILMAEQKKLPEFPLNN